MKSAVKNFVLFHVLSMLSSASMAGWADGPYVVWINYDTKVYDQINSTTKDILNERDSCIDFTRNPIFYIKKRPPKITNDLVYKAVIDKQKMYQNNLYHALIEYRDKSIWNPDSDINGLDGVIAYFPLPKPYLISFSFNGYTKKYKIKTKYISKANNKNSLREALCEVMPSITRN